MSKTTTIKEIATMGANLVVASKSDTMQACMSKMVARDIRHLPVVDEESGTVSIALYAMPWQTWARNQSQSHSDDR